ncbi:MAG: rhamnosyl transferase [Pseudochelatococcus sp.]|jgi:rhamnosyltransferase|uniref:rhamnosyl transferase n=1 Tax=Pseudochelatococcus sp. TaxID=2020869 RepID=UPI003D92B323
MERIIAGIVTFNPDSALLLRLVGAVAAEVAEIVVVTNSPMPADERARVREAAGTTPTHIDDPGGNVGLGEAYARIAARAEAAGIGRVILFDQDSSPPPGMVTALSARLSALADAGERPALVGPRPVSAAGAPSGSAGVSPGDHKPPTLHLHPRGRGEAGALAVWFAISSGSLVDLAALRAIGPFRGDFFIDAIDVEWGFRAWAKGFSCWVAEDIPMPHRLGGGQVKVPVIGWELPVQSPLRLYTYARNQAAMLGLRHVPTRWKARICAYIGAQALAYWLADRGASARPRALAQGFAAGLAGRLGPPVR